MIFYLRPDLIAKMVQVYTETNGRRLFAYTENVFNFSASYCPNGKGVSYRDVILLNALNAEQTFFNQTDDYPERFEPYVIQTRTLFEDVVLMTDPDRSGQTVIKFIIDDAHLGWIEVWYRF